ncbi:LOW QUALITY PROTEIN: EF-hand calcium-binding domain-containing protein 6 [Amazona ochrocephala]
MARVTAAEDLNALPPFTQGIRFTPGPTSTQNRMSSCGSRWHPIKLAAEEKLKKAFQMLDVDLTLTITKGNFRKVIETFIFHLTEAEFDAVLAEDEQSHSPNNDIKSARMPAQGETEKAVDFAKSVFLTALILQKIKKKEQKQKELFLQSSPAKCAVTECSLDSIKKAFKEKWCSAYQVIEKAFRAIHVSQSGFVSLDCLESVINGFIFPLSNETFQELMNGLGLKATGETAWQQFLEKFQDPGRTFENRQTIPMRKKKMRKVNPARGDEAFSSNDTVLQKLCRYIQDAYPSLKQGVLMLSEVICGKASVDRQEREYNNQCNGTGKLVTFWQPLTFRIKQIEDQAKKCAQNRTVDEVIRRLKDRVIQAPTIKYSFFACNKQLHGKINNTGLQKVLEDHGMPLDDSQFNLLTEKLGLPDGGLSYLDFVAIPEHKGFLTAIKHEKTLSWKIQNFPLPRKDASLNGPGATLCKSPNHRVNNVIHFMSAEECLSQLNDILMEVYGDTYSAFHKTDSTQDGIVNMLDFQKLLGNFLLHLRDEEFLCLIGLSGMNLTSMLNYREFCQLFHTQESMQEPPLLMPPHKKKQMITDAELACDHAHYYLVIKARTRWHDLARSFQEFDSEGNGIMQPRELKKVMFRFGIPITPEEFKQLWARYDNSKLLALAIICKRMSYQEFLQKLGIEFAPTETGLSRHTADIYGHLQAQYNNQQKKQSKQKQQTRALHVKIKKQIKDKFRDYFQDFKKAFRIVDKNRDGYGTLCDLHRILKFNYYLDHNQFNSILNSLGISIHDSKLAYFDFLSAIDDGRASKYQRQKQDTPPASFAVLSLEQTLIKRKEIVASSHDFLYKAFSLFDKEGTEVIKTLEFQQVLGHFCFKLSDKQFRHLLKNLNLYTKQQLLMPDGLTDRFAMKNSDPGEIPASSRPQKTTCSAHDLNCKTIEKKIRKKIEHSWKGILKVCKEKDISNVGEIPASDFLDIAGKFNLNLSEGEINQITTKYDFKENGRFAYYDFLQSCILFLKPQETLLLKRVIIQKPQKPLSPGPQTTSFFSAMLRIQPKILHCWRPMKRTFKSHDETHSGLLNVSDFRQVLHDYNIDLTEEKLFNILEYYDKTLTSKISYNDFLRAFIQ